MIDGKKLIKIEILGKDCIWSKMDLADIYWKNLVNVWGVGPHADPTLPHTFSKSHTESTTKQLSWWHGYHCSYRRINIPLARCSTMSRVDNHWPFLWMELMLAKWQNKNDETLWADFDLNSMFAFLGLMIGGRFWFELNVCSSWAHDWFWFCKPMEKWHCHLPVPMRLIEFLHASFHFASFCLQTLLALRFTACSAV